MTKHFAPALSSEKFLEQPTFRPEIQGLRSLAVLMVVTYHIWFGKVSGGVDVFLFISAFLLSLSSLRKIHDGKPLLVVKYWLHVFQRLLPAALTVILGTLAASYFIIAPSRWASLLADAKAAVFYYLNWHLAFNSVDYYAQDATTKTPFQHFWSLSMQGQIFILWPLLFTLIGLIVWYLRLKTSGVALLVFGSVFAASLTFSIRETASNQTFAYFDTRTRLWEFAAGALLAILLLKWKAPRKARIVMGWIGIIGLLSCGWVLPVETGFPGYLALWPLFSGALVIAAGQTESRLGADYILSTKPLQKMGAISYCLYLVHWPILILYTTWEGEERAGWIDGTLIIIASITLAWLLHTLVEKPMRALDKKTFIRKKKGTGTSPRSSRVGLPTKLAGYVKPVVTVALLLSIGGGAAWGGQIWLAGQEKAWATNAALAGTERFPGALAAGTDPTYRDLPIPMTTTEQREALDGSCLSYPGITNQAIDNPDGDSYCWVQRSGVENAPLTVVVGDSHAHHTALPVFKILAKETQQDLIVMLRPGCRFSGTGTGSYPEACKDHNEIAYQEILDLHPDNVVLISSWTRPTSNEEFFTPELEPIIANLTGKGINVIGVRDNPRWEQNMFACAQENMRNSSICGDPLDTKMADVDPSIEVLDRYPNTYRLDFTNQLCPQGFCEAIIGNIVVYMDDNHLNKSFAQTLAPIAKEQLQEQGWDPTTGGTPSDTGETPAPEPSSSDAQTSEPGAEESDAPASSAEPAEPAVSP